ncbi:lipid A-modifier LpxR family protein [Leptospira ryugenii]|uniref:lipid A-modifier LpxR family protein n=1 Tax=Leptospira ryugenii TaxID=1917863 RepID=UPI001435451E|nr:lipid A-modifier LpxR family protein [Leptospira ryugenii]
MKQVLLSILLFVFFFIGSAKLRSEPQTSPTRSIKLHWENDVFLLTDREYTNGIRAEYGQSLLLPLPASWVLHAILSSLGADRTHKQQYSGIGLVHAIYSPLNLYTSDIPYGERPYSSLGLVSDKASFFWEKSALSLELAFGQIGPSAQGKYFQGIIHQITQSPMPQGWDYQIPKQNLLQVNLDWKYFWLPQFGFQSTARLGNLDSSLSIGPILRFGKISSPNMGGLSVFDPSGNYYSEDSEFYFYLIPGVKYQTINATLGNPKGTSIGSPLPNKEDQFVILENGQTNIYGQALYNAVFDESSSSTITRFLAYEQFIGKDQPFAINYLIFNSIFNGASVPNEGLKFSILKSLLDSNIDQSKYPGLNYFLYDTLFRNETKGLSVYSRFLAYQYFYNGNLNSEETKLISLLLLTNESNAKKVYHVDLQRFQGKLSFGFMFQNVDWFMQFGVELSSFEYRATESTLPFHRYTSFQLGKKF